MANHATEANYTGEVDKSSCSRGIHESNARGGSLVLDSVVLIPVGIWLTISGKTKSLGKVIALIGLILVMVSSWTVPDSDSSAGGHLILTIVAPSLLLAYGIHGMVFGGNVPVGRLDSSARWSGTIAVFVSIGIFCLMHWYSFTPVGVMAKLIHIG